MSGVRRPRSPRAPKRTPPKGIYRGALAVGDDLGAAAEIIADEARRLAMPWAKTGDVPASIRVEQQDERTVLIIADAGAAYPNEVAGVRHPVFGPTLRNPRPAWVANQHRPFMEPAAEAKADAALKRYGQRIDRLLEKAGFK